MKDITRIRLLRCLVILLLLWDIWVTGYILTHPYVEEYMPDVIQHEDSPSNISVEGETVIFGGNSTAPHIDNDGGSLNDLFANFSEEDINMMAACVYFEAGNQSMEGKRLVVDVIVNRVYSDRFPNSVSAVLSQEGQFTTYRLVDGCDYNGIPIDCYGAVLAELQAISDGKPLDMKYFGIEVFFFRGDGKQNYFRNGGVSS